MKENRFSTPEPEELVTIAKDVDADDPEASDLLDVIGREPSEEEQPEEPTKAVTRTAVGGGPFMLESLYFRSFGERALLTREEEVELAKKIDDGTSTIRNALREAIRVFPRLKRSDSDVALFGFLYSVAPELQSSREHVSGAGLRIGNGGYDRRVC